jgi:hypothetical protein
MPLMHGPQFKFLAWIASPVVMPIVLGLILASLDNQSG